MVFRAPSGRLTCRPGPERYGSCRQTRWTSSYQWRQLLAAQLIQQFGPSAGGRRLSRPRPATDKRNTSIPWEHHRKGSRKACSPCSYCGSRKVVRQPLGEVSRNNLTRQQQRKKTRKGCLDCDVPLCIDRDCWYLWHTQNL
ncbi:hypothetical protein BDP81DRAFT_63755 [Colletotrichum phormii]|uniref:Uncharacterized protein n=1 Tax=Colletotrichum phormii TaxID=359342 RepID=A0AAJ0EEG0_9PEZI|nr:uncharacterized protein BDP81DRAFT_63755 [Colletotrichum phormii]KAK1633955.1 hypothetical protein BDP81DRAFT_63755 [Colletotrichum phormii]